MLGPREAHIETETTPAADDGGAAIYLIRKGSYYYRPNCQGYTDSPMAAGRYTLAKAEREAMVEPLDFRIYKVVQYTAPVTAGGMTICLYDDKAGGTAMLIDGKTVDITGLPKTAIDAIRALHDETCRLRQILRLNANLDLVEVTTPRLEQARADERIRRQQPILIGDGEPTP